MTKHYEKNNLYDICAFDAHTKTGPIHKVRKAVSTQWTQGAVPDSKVAQIDSTD
jgi:hypothetical protein